MSSALRKMSSLIEIQPSFDTFMRLGIPHSHGPAKSSDTHTHTYISAQIQFSSQDRQREGPSYANSGDQEGVRALDSTTPASPLNPLTTNSNGLTTRVRHMTLRPRYRPRGSTEGGAAAGSAAGAASFASSWAVQR